MDLLMQGKIERINELASEVYADSCRRSRGAADAAAVIGKSHLGLSPKDLREYSVAAVINSLRGLGAQTGLERECSEELGKRFDLPLGAMAIPLDVLEHRTLSSNYFVGVSAPQGLSFIDLLRHASVAYRLGARRLTDLQNDVGIPRQTAGNTVTWLGPGGSTAASDPTFGQVSGTPKTACLVSDVSEQLLRLSSAAEEVIMLSTARDMAVAADTVAINGAGGVEPLGVLNTPGIGSASGSSLQYSGVVGVQKTVADANAIVDPRAAGYATTPTVAELLKGRQRFTSTDSPVWRGAVHEGEIEGVRAIASKVIPASTLIYGDWSNLVIGEWGPLVLSVNNGGTRFNQAQVGIRALWMIDVFLTAPTAFVKVTGIS